jgi:RNA polymerase sigma-70 factor (ECF subfamily)
MIPKTSLELLERLQCEQFDQEAWDRFVNRYHGVLVDWARRWGAQGADCQELAQEVLFKLVLGMRNFHYDPDQSFRSWLKTVAYRTLKRQNKKLERLVLLGESHASKLFNSVEARGELHSILEIQAERELLELSSQRVRKRIQEKTWRAFELLVIQEWTGEQVANELGISISSVYVAKFNVMRMLRDEVTVLGDS